MRLATWGLSLTALWSAATWLAWGNRAIVAVALFGLLATAIQLAAVALIQPVVGKPFAVLASRWGIGMGLRLGGIVAFAAAVAWRRELFPPLPSALGYVGVVIPLLFMETRFLK